MWRRVVRRVVPDVSEDRSAFETSGTILPPTRRHIPEHCNLHASGLPHPTVSCNPRTGCTCFKSSTLLFETRFRIILVWCFDGGEHSHMHLTGYDAVSSGKWLQMSVRQKASRKAAGRFTAGRYRLFDWSRSRAWTTDAVTLPPPQLTPPAPPPKTQNARPVPLL
jgi:hypothetical protein